MFSNDEEVKQFLDLKIQQFHQKIVEIENYWQILGTFRNEFEQLRQLEIENRTNLLSFEQLRDVKL